MYKQVYPIPEWDSFFLVYCVTHGFVFLFCFLTFRRSVEWEWARNSGKIQKITGKSKNNLSVRRFRNKIKILHNFSATTTSSLMAMCFFFSGRSKAKVRPTISKVRSSRTFTKKIDGPNKKNVWEKSDRFLPMIFLLDDFAGDSYWETTLAMFFVCVVLNRHLIFA